MPPDPSITVGRTGRSGLVRYSASQFLAALLLLILAVPFADRPPLGDLIDAVVITMVMLSAMLAVGGRPRAMLVAAVLVVPVLIAKWIEHWRPGLLPPFLVPAASLAFTTVVAVQLMRFALRARVVTREVVCAGASVYLVFGWMWTFAYVLVQQADPSAFSVFGQPARSLDTFELFYFSFATLVGVAYGDITPVARLAQGLAVLQGAVSTLYVVTLIARLVALYTPAQTNVTIVNELEQA